MEPAADSTSPATHPKSGHKGKDSSKSSTSSKQGGGDLGTFFTAVLDKLGAPVTKENLGFMYAWARREGAGGAYNPLNTTLDANGATSMNSVGVKNYTSWQQGAEATAKTLQSNYYTDITSALRSGKADPNANYHGLLTWSGHGYSTLSGISTHPYVLFGGPSGSHPLGATGNTGESVAAEIAGGGGVGGVGDQHLSKSDLKAGLDSMGFATQLINSNKSLKQAFDKIVSKGIDISTSAGQAEAKSIIENTAWYQHHTAAQQQFETLRYSHPDEWQRQIDKQSDSLKAEAESLGVQVDPAELEKMAHISLRNGLTSDEVNQLFAKHFDYNPQQKTYVGTAGSAIGQIQQQASAYYVPISAQQIQHYTRQVIAGNLDPNSLSERFKQQALSMFPYLKDQLDAGQTVADVVDPYKQLMANTLEVNPDSIGQHDQTILSALQTKGQDGQVGLMPLWQFQQKLYSDPRWLYTQNAKQSLVSTTGSILQKMGLIT